LNPHLSLVKQLQEYLLGGNALCSPPSLKILSPPRFRESGTRLMNIHSWRHHARGLLCRVQLLGVQQQHAVSIWNYFQYVWNWYVSNSFV
jgi:hypothetical protein